MIFQWMRKVLVTTPYKQSLLLLPFWVRRRKGGSTWITSNLWSHRNSNFWTNQSFVKQGYSSASTRYLRNRWSQPSQLYASARLLHLNYFLAKYCACSTKILFDSCRVFLKHLFSHPASKASLCLLGLGGEMEALPKSRPTFAEVAAGQSSGLVNLVFSRQTVIFFRMRA